MYYRRAGRERSSKQKWKEQWGSVLLENAMGETIADNSRTTLVSRAWRLSARSFKDIVKAKDKKTASIAAWKLLFYEHPRPDPARAIEPQLEAMACFSAWQRSLARAMLLTPCWVEMMLHAA